MPKQKKIPNFKSETEEKEFWAVHDSADFLDWSKAKKVSFPNLKPSNKTISLRLPEGMLYKIKLEANRQGVPYQSLVKTKLYQAFCQ